MIGAQIASPLLVLERRFMMAHDLTRTLEPGVTDSLEIEGRVIHASL